MYNTPHGLANAVLLPYVLRAYGKSVYRKLKELAVAAGLCSSDVPDSVAAEVFIRKIETMNKHMGIPKKLPGIRWEDIRQLSKFADHEGNPLYPVPRLMDRRSLEQFYVMVAEDLDVSTARKAAKQPALKPVKEEPTCKQPKSTAS